MRNSEKAAVIALMAALTTAACAAPSPPKTCTPDENARFAESIATRRHVVEGVFVCGVVSGRPYEHGGEHGLHAYIPVRVEAPGGATYITQIIPNEELIGHVVVHRGDAIFALGQFVYPNERFGYEGLIHETHHTTHTGGADGYVSVNGRTYR
ncbi:MAG: hypothetical protein JOY59_10460 [Candidatus Eremiobacteraeota bacterium]|nr:hypothetical protein [Candidatus Eremiobacteraeota bacterium]